MGHGPGLRQGRAGRAPPPRPLPSAPLPPPRTRAAVPRATPPRAPLALLPGRPAPLGPAAPFLNGSRPGAAGRRGSPAGAVGSGREGNGHTTATQRPRAPLPHTGFACVGTAGWVLPRLPAGAVSGTQAEVRHKSCLNAAGLESV